MSSSSKPNASNVSNASHHVLSVQIGSARKVQIAGRSVLTAIFKTPVQNRVTVQALGLQGDEQADPTVHGGLDKAIYAYPWEHYGFWQVARQEFGLGNMDAALQPGALGENLTLQGLLEGQVWVGDALRFPDCVLRVTQPREPCFKFNAAMGFNQAAKRMAQSGFCGFYLAVDTPGTIAADDALEVVPGPRQTAIPSLFQARMFKQLRD